MYAVILAGGGGTRLWPLSTPGRPKPFIPLLGIGTLFERTVRRLLDGDELGLAPEDVFVVADGRHAGLVRRQAPAGVVVLDEPVGRNTAAAIALATVAIERPDDEVMVVLPADHAIEREDAFRAVLRDAAAELATGAFGIESPLVTLGIRMDRPATEYGYLIPDVERGVVGPRKGAQDDQDDQGDQGDRGVAHGQRGERGEGGQGDRDQGARLTAYPLQAFEEKPDAARAARLLSAPGVAWNAGMFLWRRRAIRAALGEVAPDILGAVAAAHRAGALAEAYPSIRSTSIDYAVMEPAAAAGRVVMAALDVGWSDLGGWSALLAALGCPGDGRVVGAGEAAEAGPSDLVVRRRDGRLVLEAGPLRGILDADGPSALLVGAAPGRPIVTELIERVGAAEERLS
jgi:mannose-1-phosphate guanylyltransferase